MFSLSNIVIVIFFAHTSATGYHRGNISLRHSERPTKSYSEQSPRPTKFYSERSPKKSFSSTKGRHSFGPVTKTIGDATIRAYGPGAAVTDDGVTGSRIVAVTRGDERQIVRVTGDDSVVSFDGEDGIFRLEGGANGSITGNFRDKDGSRGHYMVEGDDDESFLVVSEIREDDVFMVETDNVAHQVYKLKNTDLDLAVGPPFSDIQAAHQSLSIKQKGGDLRYSGGLVANDNQNLDVDIETDNFVSDRIISLDGDNTSANFIINAKNWAASPDTESFVAATGGDGVDLWGSIHVQEDIQGNVLPQNQLFTIVDVLGNNINSDVHISAGGTVMDANAANYNTRNGVHKVRFEADEFVLTQNGKSAGGILAMNGKDSQFTGDVHIAGDATGGFFLVSSVGNNIDTDLTTFVGGNVNGDNSMRIINISGTDSSHTGKLHIAGDATGSNLLFADGLSRSDIDVTAFVGGDLDFSNIAARFGGTDSSFTGDVHIAGDATGGGFLVNSSGSRIDADLTTFVGGNVDVNRVMEFGGIDSSFTGDLHIAGDSKSTNFLSSGGLNVETDLTSFVGGEIDVVSNVFNLEGPNRSDNIRLAAGSVSAPVLVNMAPMGSDSQFDVEVEGDIDISADLLRVQGDNHTVGLNISGGDIRTDTLLNFFTPSNNNNVQITSVSDSFTTTTATVTGDPGVSGNDVTVDIFADQRAVAADTIPMGNTVIVSENFKSAAPAAAPTASPPKQQRHFAHLAKRESTY